MLIREIESGCQGRLCSTTRIDPAMAEAIRRLGFSLHEFALVVALLDTLPMLVSLLVSGLLIWRRPRDRMAVFAAITLVLFSTVLQSSITALSDDALGTWPVAIVQFAGSVCLLWFLCVFPDGQWVPHWTRYLVVAWVAWCALGYFSPLDWPVNQAPRDTIFPLGVLATFCATLIAQAQRYRHHSTDLQRQQAKWVMFGFAVSLACILSDVLVLWRFGPQPPDPAAAVYLIINGLLFVTGLLLMPITLALAVLRYRLFEIDLLISRALVYATLTGGVIGAYIVVVGYLDTLFKTVDNLPISLVAAGLVAVAFQPARQWLQRVVNRFVYGDRDDPYAVLSRLDLSLENSVAADAVLPTIVQTIAEALRLPYASIVGAEADGTHTLLASCGRAAEHVLFLPLVFGNQEVGELRLAPRSGSSGFEPADRRILEDIARHAGAAVHAARLSADLQRSREQLVAAREEERRRLRRDLHDGLGPALAAHGLKIGAARAFAARDPAAADRLLRQLEDDVQTMLEDVRRLAYALRPPSLDQLGLDGALHELAARYEPRVTTSVSIHADVAALPAGVEVAAYRITDEALTNVVRHSRAANCEIRLSHEPSNGVRLEIADDGVGLPDRLRPGIGLNSMRERAEELGGEFHTEPNHPRGTRVIVNLPVRRQ
ncbi:MAG: sensor histidine kinase [Chloroflexi bacterium]|nr:sensor histidine kinase [Chloroflexota bacterium]